MHEIVKVQATASYDSYTTTFGFKHPKLVASCFCSRKPGYYFFNAYFLIFLITVSSLTIFSIDPKLPQNRLQTTYTLLLTSISFKWVINRSLPTVSYLTSLDKYAIICIFFVCLTCVWHSLVGSLWPDNIELDRILLLIFTIAFILIHIVLFVWTYAAHKKIKELIKEEREFVKLFKHSNVKEHYYCNKKNIIAKL